MRVIENLNRALHGLLADDSRAYLLGEDVADPYGGAFKATRGLATRFPERVLSTPISEDGITGVATGLALAGDTAIVEITYGDFLALGQLSDFAVYGRPLPLRLIVRCPMGGGRGYGPGLQTHVIGMPGLSLYEMSPFHDNAAVLAAMLSRGEPGVLFEDRILYTRQMHHADRPFRVRMDGELAVVDVDDRPDVTVIAPGGVVHRALTAMRSLLTERGISCRLLVPSRLFPLDLGALVPHLGAVVVVAEERTPGGTWGSEVAHLLRRPVTAAVRPEGRAPLQESGIRHAVLEALRGTEHAASTGSAGRR
ncbi:transketolase C-terminal domain-containing protein [Nonomuraea longicatena]|uniref:3-methyl-2-oxobutanoate dehydrogenase (2-methylpropanoyl-transferring) n=1 Tax=Nonomuraea longicatena TaxID=83682 RepID=A0ABN1PIL9_9ACTN